MSTDPNDLSALTPGHFLRGEPIVATVDPEAIPTQQSSKKHWNEINRIKGEFWKRWTSDYLNQLQHRYKWKQASENARPGMLVLVKDEDSAVVNWPLGRIVATYPGSDGYVRVADVKMKNGIYRRSIQKLAPLPAPEESEEQLVIPKVKSNLCDKKSQDLSGSESNKATNSEKRSTRRGQSKNISLWSTVMFVCCLIMPNLGETKTVKDSFSITKFASKPGIYFDNIGQINLKTTEWKLIIYYDLDPYHLDLALLKNGMDTLNHLCDQIWANKPCNQTIIHFQHVIEEFQIQNLILKSEEKVNRIKRGVIDIVGKGANWLFGLLDQDYAKQMEQTINSVRDNEDYLLSLWHNQTSVIDSTINIIKRDQLAIEQKFKETDKIFSEIKNIIKAKDEEIFQGNLSQMFNTVSLQITMIIINLQRIQNAIVQALIDIHHNQMNPLLLSPNQLLQETKNIRAHLPPTLKLPIRSENIQQLYQLMTTEAQVTNNFIIFQSTIPIVTTENYDLFKLLPIPTVINGTFVEIVPSTTYLSIDNQKERYYPMNEHEKATCQEIEQQKLICTQHHPIYKKGASLSSCEVSLFIEAKINKNCKLVSINSDSKWIQLSGGSEWIYSVQTESTANLICTNEMHQTSLTGSGILTIPADCVLKQGTTTIHGHQVYSSNVRTSYNRLGNISDDDIQGLLHVDFSNSTVFSSHIKQLENIKDEIKEHGQLHFSRTVQPHLIHNFSVSYAGIAVLLIIGIYLIYKHRQSRTVPVVRASRSCPDLDFTIQV